MKRIVHRSGLLVLLCLFVNAPGAFCQSVTGIWKGYFISDDGSQYRLEFQVKQNDDGSVSVKGVSYSWQDDIKFYGKATMTGSFVKTSKNFRIKEIRTVEVKSGGGGTCIMNYDLTYSRSGAEEFLEGTYLGKPEVKTGNNPYEWGDCGGGTVYLRKVVTSDFYIEPFLRNKDNPVVPSPRRDSVAKVTPPPKKSTGLKTTPPVPKSGITTRNTPSVKKSPVTTQKTVAKPVIKPRTDTLARITTPVIRNPEQVRETEIKRPVANIPTPEVLKSRSNELMKALVVSDPNVTVKLYDNGEVDDDTISIYYDKKLLLANQRLSTVPITLKLKLDGENTDHELVMVAENLGRIPPNTALMVVDAGDQRFDVRITSTEQKNALVRFRYERPR